MGTFDNLYLNQIKQLQEENNKLKQIIKEGHKDTVSAEGKAIWGGPDDWAARGVAREYAKPLNKQAWFKGKGFLGSPEDIDRRNKAAQRRAADEQKMKAAGFGDPTPLGIGSPPQTFSRPSWGTPADWDRRPSWDAMPRADVPFN